MVLLVVMVLLVLVTEGERRGWQLKEVLLIERESAARVRALSRG
jgi:hypothetical protein